MASFDLALGSGALVAPSATLGLLGPDAPSEDAEHLFRRCGPIWLTFAAAHLVAAGRGTPGDWWALAWLRGTEVATDIVWSRSPAWRRESRVGLWSAGAATAADGGGLCVAGAEAGRALARRPAPAAWRYFRRLLGLVARLYGLLGRGRKSGRSITRRTLLPCISNNVRRVVSWPGFPSHPAQLPPLAGRPRPS